MRLELGQNPLAVEFDRAAIELSAIFLPFLAFEGRIMEALGPAVAVEAGGEVGRRRN